VEKVGSPKKAQGEKDVKSEVEPRNVCDDGSVAKFYNNPGDLVVKLEGGHTI